MMFQKQKKKTKSLKKEGALAKAADGCSWMRTLGKFSLFLLFLDKAKLWTETEGGGEVMEV